jgi:hypothetical protein
LLTVADHRCDETLAAGRGWLAIQLGQHRRNQNATGRGRGVCPHTQATVGDLDRLPCHRLVRGEVGGCEHAAALADPVAHGRGDFAGVERRRTVGRQALKAVGHIRQTQDLALARRCLGEESVRLRGAVDDRP